MTDDLNVTMTAVSPLRMLVPLALAQFICSFAGSNMDVMIYDIILRANSAQAEQLATREDETRGSATVLLLAASVAASWGSAAPSASPGARAAHHGICSSAWPW